MAEAALDAIEHKEGTDTGPPQWCWLQQELQYVFAFSVGLRITPITKSISKSTEWLSYVKTVKSKSLPVSTVYPEAKSHQTF